MKFLKTYTSQDLLAFFTPREGEKKLGQTIELATDDLEKSSAEYVLIGIPEDIGPRANFGKLGAYNAWEAFLSSFLSMQSNSFLSGKNILLGGAVKLDDLQVKAHKATLPELRKLIESVDHRVQTVVEQILKTGKTPIIIGGGHNNCFPIINSFSAPISVLNIDPHADIRPLEGRHSGNGFSYALESGKLGNYFVLGLHEEYNSEYILDQFSRKNNLNFLTFNQIINESWEEKTMVKEVKKHLLDTKIGLELDMDSIKNMPVSAFTPIGFSEESIKKLLFLLTKDYTFHYFHICEGAPINEEEKIIVGKTIAYTVSNFIKNTRANTTKNG